MSIQKHILEITPPEHQKVSENASFRGFECPVCNAQGGWREQTGRDEYKPITCDYCDGTGKVKTEVLITWAPDYD